MLITLFLANSCEQEDPTLFSSVRAYYQSILEDLLECNNLTDAASGDFAARHRSASYLCRYRSCPRAVAGFNSSNFRREHENSHVPCFRCTDPACGFLGRVLKDRAAMNKHNKKYHDDGGLAAIPASLRRTSALPQQGRSRFLLNGPSSASRKRPFHAAENDDIMSKVDMTIDPVPVIPHIGPSTNENQEQYTVNDKRDRNGRTLLARACTRDVDEAEKWLEARPQDIDIPDNAGNTPLQIAALEGITEIVKLLLNAGCDITSKNIDHDTPLIDAVENGHLGVVRLLLEAGMDPEGKNAKGQEPLELIPFDDGEAGNIKAALLVAKNIRDARRKAQIEPDALLKEEYGIKCICRVCEDSGHMVRCVLCDTWQHIQCYYTDQYGKMLTEELDNIDHFCADCQPRLLNPRSAIERQRIRLEALDDQKIKEGPRSLLQKPLPDALLTSQELKASEESWENYCRHNGPAISSSLSVKEQKRVPALIRRHGTNWEAIANNLKSKDSTTVWKAVNDIRIFR